MAGQKRRAIRNMLGRLGMQAAPSQVVEALDDYGVDVSADLVVRVKAQIIREENKALRERSKHPPKVKSRRRPQKRKNPKRR